VHDGDVVDASGDSVHAIGGRAGKDGVVAWTAEAAEEGIDRLVAADAEEEV